MRFPTKIPTLLGLLLLIVLVGGISIASERFFRTATTASGSIQPKNSTITNATDTSLTGVWTTESPATGVVELTGPDGKKQVFFDNKKYLAHSITGRNLSPDTSYAVTILSNGKTFQDAAGPLGRTAPTLPLPTSGLGPAYGTVFTANNQPAEGALVLLTVEGSQTLSTLVTPSGSWMIPLNLLRTSDLTRYITTATRMTEQLTVTFDGQASTAITDTLNDSPVPMMILGKSYDFRKQQAKNADGAPIAQEFPAVLGDQTAANPTSFSVTLAVPLENSSLTTTLPLIQGTGVPGKSVAITLGISNPVSGLTTIGTDGMWRYTPESPLAPGKQSVTITTQNANNQPVAVTHIFEILKSGTQVLGTATPSGELTPAFQPTPTSTAAGKPVPVSGSILPTILIIFFGALLLTGGAVALTW